MVAGETPVPGRLMSQYVTAHSNGHLCDTYTSRHLVFIYVLFIKSVSKLNMRISF